MEPLRLHKRLYKRKAIDATVEAYAEVCTAAVKSDGDHYVVSFSEVDDDVADVLAREFANYALAETVERR